MTTQRPLRYRAWFSNGHRSTLFSPVASLAHVRRTADTMADGMDAAGFHDVWVIAIVAVRK